MEKSMDITSFFKMEKQGRRDKHLVVSPPENGKAEIQHIVDNIDLGSWSEITINAKPEYIEALSDDSIKDKIEKDIRKKLNTTLQYTLFKFDKTPDMIKWNPRFLFIGEHGKEGLCKLHYHGIVSGIPNDMMAHFIKLVRHTIGRTELKYIRYNDSYKKYMFKSYNEEYPEQWGYHSYIRINI